MFRIVQNKEKCIGCGACVSVCDNWEMDDDGKAKPKNTEIEKAGCNKEAAEMCPVQCIKVEEE